MDWKPNAKGTLEAHDSHYKCYIKTFSSATNSILSERLTIWQDGKCVFVGKCTDLNTAMKLCRFMLDNVL